MNFTKQLSVLALAIFCFCSITAQDILKLVPKEASFVGLFNTSQIKTKMDFEAVINLPMFQDLNNNITKKVSRKFDIPDSMSFVDLRKHGFDLDNKSCFYFVMGEKMYYGALVLSITDKSKFSQFVKMMNRDPEGEKIIEGSGYSVFKKYDTNIAWNDNKAAFFMANMSPVFKDSIDRYLSKKYNYNSSYYYEKSENPEDENKMTSSEFYELKRAYRDSIEAEWFNINTPLIISGWKHGSFSTNNKFKEYAGSDSDVAMMLDYATMYNSLLHNSYKYDREMRQFMQYLGMFYKGMTMYSKGKFEKDQIVMEMDMIYSKELNEIFAQSKKKKISKDFLKYMNKDLMGYYALALDIEGISEGVKANLKKSLPQIPKYGNIAVSAIEILETFLDEKAIYNIFSGDIVFAFNGIKELEVVYKTYDYDEEFNKIDIIDTTYKKLPDLLLMVGVGNKNDVEKFLKLGVNSKVLKKEGNLYSVDIKRNKFPVHFCIHDDILFVGNNLAFMKNPIAKAKQDQLSKQHKKNFKKNIFAAYANTAEIARYISDVERSFKDKKSLIETSSLFKTAWATGKKTSNGIQAKYTVQLSESEHNSLSDLFRFFNELFVIYENKM